VITPPRRYLDVSKINKLGWKTKTSLKDGLEKTFEYMKENWDHLQEK
jgi:nucleoside-diphosphate-sugar epimerase